MFFFVESSDVENGYENYLREDTFLEGMQSLIKEKTGIELSQAKLIEVVKKVKAHSSGTSFEESLRILSEFTSLPSWFVSEITLNETMFFRHPSHFKMTFDYLRKLSVKQSQAKILSLGCSTGEEAYSLAMVAKESFNSNFSVEAIDISARSIRKAKKASYLNLDVDRVPDSCRGMVQKNSKSFIEKSRHKVVINDDIRDAVRFKEGNAFTVPLDLYDVIYVRNILSNFSSADQEVLMVKLARHLKPGGVLFIGASERFPSNLDELLVKESQYQLVKK